MTELLLDAERDLSSPDAGASREKTLLPSDLNYSLVGRRSAEHVAHLPDPVMTAVPLSPVVPTLNEELNLPRVLAAVPEFDLAELSVKRKRNQ